MGCPYLYLARFAPLGRGLRSTHERDAVRFSESDILAVRFSEDRRLLDLLQADDRIAAHLRRFGSLEGRRSMRSRLLSCAVRVDKRLIPRITRAFEQLQQRTGLQARMEAYVHDDASIRASVMKGRSQTLVLLSSGAVNKLVDQELEFVIGHELGHAVFNHLDVAAANLIESEAVDPRSCLKLLAWQRAAEISADRCGLLCCGSLEVAATALFKTVSGVDLGSMLIDPHAFAEQWEHLASEVIQGGGMEDHQISHPFPPLRVKAMIAFWNSDFFDDPNRAGEQRVGQIETDQEITRLLAMLDPLSRESKESADPILEEFFLWGGLYIAVANGEFHELEKERLATLVSSAKLRQAIATDIPSAEDCLRRFQESVANRQSKIKAMEIHRILQGLLQIAISDSEIDAAETQALEQLAGELGIGSRACRIMISNILNER